jgi:two-component system, OmpR family, clock-associated histidine kinase SasA
VDLPLNSTALFAGYPAYPGSSMVVLSDKSNLFTALQLLLFVDDRYYSTHEYHKILNYLDENHLKSGLRIIDVSEQPGLAEHFKLVATPTLIKLSPAPKQVFSGYHIISELENWLPTWIEEAEVHHTEDFSPDNIPESRTDITQIQEMVRLADEVFRLRRQQQDLKEQLRFKEQAISILAHDLRNPLTAANLALDTLAIARDPNDLRAAHLQPELMQKLVSRAKEQVMIVDRLVSDILHLSQGAVVDITIIPHRFDINDLLSTVIQQLIEPFHRKEQQILTDIPQDLPPVYADIDRIRQVFINLLDNASKYTPKGGKIQVVALHRTSQKVQISVIDNGPAIPASDYDLIFQKYYRMGRDESEDGYGLGLPLCKSIIRAHFGQIWVESSPRGNSFHFTLPVHLS